MNVRFSEKTKDDFRKHRDYLRRIGKSDGHKYQSYELDGISKSLKKNITKGLEDKKEHQNSIYPKEFEYNSEDYKMYVDKKSHHIVFYKIEHTKSGKDIIQIDKCIHSKELQKELDKKGIKPMENADQSLLKDMEEVQKEDEVAAKDDEEEKGKEEDVYDEETGEKVKRIVYTGPKGGRYYKTNKGEKVYLDEKKTYKSLKQILMESKIISLFEYIKKGNEHKEHFPDK